MASLEEAIFLWTVLQSAYRSGIVILSRSLSFVAFPPDKANRTHKGKRDSGKVQYAVVQTRSAAFS